MHIKAELEALRDDWRRIADGMKPSGSKRAHIEFAYQIDAIIARLPPDAVVVPREPTPEILQAAVKPNGIAAMTSDVASSVWRSMLQAAEENSDDRG